MNRKKLIAKFLFLATVVSQITPLANAQNFSLHPPIKGLPRVSTIHKGTGYLEFDYSTKTLTIFGYNKISSELTAPYKNIAEKVVIGSGVKQIGCDAFSNFKQLKEVTSQLGCNDLELINEYAFVGCNKLETALLPSTLCIGERAFYNCYALKTINFENLLYLAEDVFVRCNALTEATFPSIQKMEWRAFMYCDNLRTIKMCDQAICYGHKDFQNNHTSLDERNDEYYAHETVIEPLPNRPIPERYTRFVKSRYDRVLVLSSSEPTFISLGVLMALLYAKRSTPLATKVVADNNFTLEGFEKNEYTGDENLFCFKHFIYRVRP